MRVAKSIIVFCALIPILSIPSSALTQGKRDLASIHARLAQEVRHELIMLSNYSVFDNLEFEIKGIDTVILSGQVTRPTLKSAAESVVRRLEGVSKVVNKIEVLPLSPNDDQIRLAVYRAVYSKPGLDRYGMRAVPPIHIIVSNGTVSLVGIVANQADKDLAGIAAKEVSGTFGVTNCLKIEKK
jgi:hyperosmotically inducible protein